MTVFPDRMSVEELAKVARIHGSPLLRLPKNPNGIKSTAEKVQDLLIEKYPDDGPIECENCGFVAPDTLEIPTCPGCGLAFGAQPKEEEEMSDRAEATAPVVEIGSRRPKNGVVGNKSLASRKAEKQKEDAEIANAQATQAEAAARKRLEQAEARLASIRTKGAELAYEFACVLREIYEGDLWRAELAEGYRSFIHYAKERWGVQKDMCWAYLQIAKVFTPEKAAGLTPTRLRLLSRVPDEDDREKLLKEVRDGKIKTHDDLAAKVKEARQAAGASTEKKTKKGQDSQVVLAGRHKPGIVVAEGAFNVRKGGKLVFKFELGGQAYEVHANEEDTAVSIKHVKVK